MHRPLLAVAAATAILTPATALADEVFVGVYAHAVDTPFTFRTGESGADILAG
jgi:hypothetical protein